MRRPRLVPVLVPVVVLVYVLVLKRHYDSHNALPQRPPRPAPKAHTLSDWLSDSGGRVRFGIMFDAGSTGTRIHVFKFRPDQNQTRVPELLEENFKSISPGLSSFAEDPPKCRVGLVQLLDLARSKVPVQFQGSTPVFLKATAGLRLLQREQAQRVLNQVRDVLHESPFLFSDQNVSILDGAEEGVSAWLTVNYLLGALGGDTESVGVLDLGGGSTQVTFSPRSKFVEFVSTSDLHKFSLFESNYRLYTHSYLGLGLMEARAAVLRQTSSDSGGAVLSPCLAPDSGHSGSSGVYEACSKRVEAVLKDTVKPVEQQQTFYAFSYYYDRALDIRAIDSDSGGSVTVGQFSSAAQRVCAGEILKPDQSPLLCLDLVYISVLLRELGFNLDSELKLKPEPVSGEASVFSSCLNFSSSDDDSSSSSYLDPVVPVPVLVPDSVPVLVPDSALVPVLVQDSDSVPVQVSVSEVEPKFVKGSKRYGRRSRPEKLDSGPDQDEDHNRFRDGLGGAAVIRGTSVESVESLQSDEENRPSSGQEPGEEPAEEPGGEPGGEQEENLEENLEENRLLQDQDQDRDQDQDQDQQKDQDQDQRVSSGPQEVSSQLHDFSNVHRIFCSAPGVFLHSCETGTRDQTWT
ncbi:hypothetical protein WMY93_031069 [Mugilogobius chulae]|uniref:Ectonucleoside triphosphate diphosphohydrolase 6 n=1 Tax=Mugilogobius chulae TaxID=88201 RepID=A0AAW0MH55_9GOBI